MRLNNGRTSYEELRKKYERTIIRHNLFDDGTARTTCILVQGNKAHIGIAKFSNRTFNFSKKKGRAIAQGRAELAHAISNKEVTPRVSQETRREKLCYTVELTEGNTFDNVLTTLFESNES